jgi:hypothetical protein
MSKKDDAELKRLIGKDKKAGKAIRSRLAKSDAFDNNATKRMMDKDKADLKRMQKNSKTIM